MCRQPTTVLRSSGRLRGFGWVHYDKFPRAFILRVKAAFSEGAGCRGFLRLFCLFFLLGENCGAKARSEAKRNGAILSQLNSGFFEVGKNVAQKRAALMIWKNCGAEVEQF